ncbi:YbhB/YbcL family Raf kinase inhibitor-like protein [Thermofilum pendens]|uniref:Phospholipid-binding protein, PBP family n=1 Tax=Thermofilum pendens (strain DSM 2475 / Hrk 5) TaxID=368408 RepID=A1RYR5_THEPD|nr:YbhB/YbcL family Raf kinase inhibitor-like protein [Thermofilum pendens]ABL78345.1 phospholipid-binding protein, PBP family [Thermofilum pendens Hrk 5]
MNKRYVLLAALLLAVLLAVAYVALRPRRPSIDELLGAAKKGARVELRVAGLTAGRMPREYTCDGADESPDVSWGELPPGTRSLVLLCVDPDAPRGTFVHWVLYNVPASATRVPRSLPKAPTTPFGLQGVNDFGFTGYGGPCPPSGTHRYVFVLLALDSELALSGGADALTVLSKASGHVIGYGEVVLTYSRG